MTAARWEEQGLGDRLAGTIHHGDDDDGHGIMVSHQYDLKPEPCADCGSTHDDAGYVNVFMYGPDETVGMLLEAGDALVLAEHLRRAANWVLDQFTDTPDIEREAARFTEQVAS